MHRSCRAAVLIAAVVATVASAADVPVAGTRAVIRRHGSHEKLVFSSRDGAWSIPITTTGNPGPLEIDVSSPAHPDPVTLHVPPVTDRSGWSASVGAYGVVHRFKFRNRSAPNGFSAIGSITWTDHSSFKLTVRAALLDLSGPQGGFRIRVTDGTNSHCARFDGASVVADGTGYFSARGAMSAGLTDCSAASLGEPATSPCALTSGGAACGGTCASDEECTLSVSPASCGCTGGTGLACGDSAPVCNGYCAPGTHCGGATLRDIFGRTCQCVPDDTTACGDAEYPTCGGACADPTKVCRARAVAYSLGGTSHGCTCSPPGACYVDIGAPGFEMCGPGSDCPPDTVCSSAFLFAGCFAQCIDPAGP